jgi:DNA topoisomerase-1
MSKLVIVESPGKIDKIKSYLGDGWEVAACYGHIRDLPENEMGFTPPDFRPVYVSDDRGAATIQKLKRLASKADAVYLATDPDREGESISWHLKEALGLDSPLRVTFGEINAPAVKRAVVNPRNIDMKGVAAQELRRVLDRDVGYSVSPALCKQAGVKLSAGRVQSPAVRLVVERERAIRSFKPTQHFGVELIFGDWSANWNVKPLLVGDAEYMLDRAFAESVAKVRNVEVVSFDASEGKRGPPAPFITSTLQQAASNKLGFDPEYTMKLAQTLYESGLGHEGAITYMRTDNPNLPDEALADLFVEAQKRGLSMADEPRRWKAKEGAQIGHPAIIPTHFDIEEAGSTDDEKALYRLIWQRAVACQIEDALYNVRKTTLRGAVDGKAVMFEATGRVLKRKGWLAVLDGDDTEESGEAESSNPIPALTVGQSITASDGKLLVKRTKAPSRYTKASLIKKLEDEGIGRPSTYASIMKNIETRGYIEDKARQLHATKLGETVVDGLVGHFSFIELDFTKWMESTLDRVAEGKAGYKATISEFHATLMGELDKYGSVIAIKPAFPCPDCGRALHRIPSPKEAGKFFWGCGGHPACEVTLPDLNGKPGPKKVAAKPSGHKCPGCGSDLIHRVGAAKPGKKAYNFWGCSGYPKCDKSFDDAAGKPGKLKTNKSK